LTPLSSCSPYLPLYLLSYPHQLHPFYLHIIIYLYKFLTDFFIPPKHPHSYCMPAQPPTLPFRFFVLFIAFPLLPAPYTIFPIYIPLLFYIPPPLPGPPHPPTPYPSFSLFDSFMDAFLHVFLFYSIYTCTYMITSIESMTFDRFLGVKPAARARGIYCYIL
jgi:hypothetical protein